MPGTREYMQDRFSIRLSDGTKKDIDFLGVFDGHGPNGGKIAEHISKELPRLVMEKLNASQGRLDFREVIRQSHVELDRKMKFLPFVIHEEGLTGGSTAASLWVKDNTLYAANVGDSRIIICVNGKKINLTEDHRPTSQAEFSRISRSGGYVRFQRVGSVLAVSRAFGNYEFKSDSLSAEEQTVSVVPTVHTMPLPERFDFILLATDGLFDYLSDKAVVRYVSRKRKRGVSLEKICSKILRDLETTQTCFGQCPRELDNITIILAIQHRGEKCRDC